MKKTSRNVLLGVAAMMATCFCITSSSYKVSADATVKAPQGVVVRSASYTTKNVIKVPEKKVAVTPKKTSKTLDRGLSIKSNNANNVVDYATGFVGFPYVWGATGPRAFDCSGFTSYVYRRFGVSLSRVSGDQFHDGVAVSKSALSPGDLVFFNTYGRISHVGIYIGGGRFVHAASSKVGVTISNLNEGYYASRYAGARRVK